jgi:hypothetical protein
LTAVGTQGSNRVFFSQPVVVSVESNSSIAELIVAPTQITFGFAGQQIPLTVTGKFADGTSGDVTHSPLLSYSSGDVTVALVASDGIVTPVGPGATGSTQITITYRGQSRNLKVSVPNTIRGDLNDDKKLNQDDLNIILAALNTPATKPVDARDLNGDGIINILDANILVTLCTQSSCVIPCQFDERCGHHCRPEEQDNDSEDAASDALFPNHRRRECHDRDGRNDHKP